MVAQVSVRLNADACSRCPEVVTQRRSSGSRPTVSDRTRGGTRLDRPDFVPLTCTPSGSALLHCQHRQRNFDEVANPHCTQL
jgi:hypothetical protein